MSSTPPPRFSPFPRLAEGYWVESRRPLASLVFIAPLLIVYEAGVLVLGTQTVRNGADVWLRQFLDLIGFGQYFLLPILTVCILLAWHYTTRQPWKITRGLLWGMTGECLLLSICLWLLLRLQGSLWHGVTASIQLSIRETAGNVVRFLGAGIYEELLFRLILLSLILWVLRRLRVGPRTSMISAVLLTSLLFAAAHHVGQYREAFSAFDFLFRTLAGVFFSILFVCRGFGITAGTHAGYDILVGLFVREG